MAENRNNLGHQSQPSFGDEVKSFFSSTFGGWFGQRSNSQPDIVPAKRTGFQQPQGGRPVANQPSTPAPRVGQPGTQRNSASAVPTAGQRLSTSAIDPRAVKSSPGTASTSPNTTRKELEDGWMVLDDTKRSNPKPRPASESPITPRSPGNDGLQSAFNQTVEDGAPSMDPENIERFDALFAETKVNEDLLRGLSWMYGIPTKYRASAWKIMLGIVPPWPYLVPRILGMKRGYYKNYANKFMKAVDSNDDERQLIMMIRSGIKNTALKIRLFNSASMLHLIERVVYVWLKQTATVSYHDGITQMPLPIVYAYLPEYFDDLATAVPDSPTEDQLSDLEADVYYTMVALYERGVQDFFAGSPDKAVSTFQRLLTTLDAPLVAHLQSLDIQYLTVVFPWLESLLIDTIQKLPLLVQIWDRYIAGNHFGRLHVITCAHIAARYSKQIQGMTSAVDVYYFFNNMPLSKLNYSTLELILEKARRTAELEKIYTMATDPEAGLAPIIDRRRRKSGLPPLQVTASVDGAPPKEVAEDEGNMVATSAAVDQSQQTPIVAAT